MKKQQSELSRWALVLIAVAMMVALPTGEAQAQDDPIDEELASLERGPIVRRQLLHRSGRLELQPMMGFSVNDAYIRNGVPALSVSYYLNNVFGLSAGFGFGALQLDTSLRSNLAQTINEERMANVSYSKVNWIAEAGLVSVPVFGKFSLLNSVFSHYDFHLMGGVALMSEGAVAALEGGLVDEGLNSMRPSLMLGAGLRFFMGKMFSLNLQARNYLTTRAEISDGSATPQFGNTVMLSVGVGIFLPGEVKIAR